MLGAWVVLERWVRRMVFVEVVRWMGGAASYQQHGFCWNSSHFYIPSRNIGELDIPLSPPNLGLPFGAAVNVDGARDPVLG